MSIGDKVYIADKPTLDATKAAVETKASQTSVNTANTNINTINTNIGATNNTGGSSTTGTVMAKLNAILTWFTNTWTSTRAGYLDTTVTSRESEASAAARYNALVGTLGTINTSTTRGAVKSVQRGTVNMVGTYMQISIATVNPSKCKISLYGATNIYDGGDSYYTIIPYILSLTSAILTLAMEKSGITQPTGTFSWEIVEYY